MSEKVLGYFKGKFDRKTIKPASIECTVNREGNVRLSVDGRVLEEIELTFIIMRKICQTSNIEFDVFLEILKEEYKLSEILENEENKDNDKDGLNLFNEMFKDLK